MIGQKVSKTAERLRSFRHQTSFNAKMPGGDLGSESRDGVEDEEELDSEFDNSRNLEFGAPNVGNSYRIRAWHRNKGPYDFDQIKLAQDLTGTHQGAIWCVKFSPCGRLLATAGQDNSIRLWALKECLQYFVEMRKKFGVESGRQLSVSDISTFKPEDVEFDRISLASTASSSMAQLPDAYAPFASTPIGAFRGHTADVLDVCWSKVKL